MWRSYMITAWRSIVRNRLFALVNILGLALAVVACLLIALVIQYEWSYDKQSPHANHIWRAYNETIADGKVVTQDANTHGILGPSLKADLPEVIDFTRLYNNGQSEVNILFENGPIQIKNAWMTDPAFLRMFPQQFISGDINTCLTAPYSVVITSSIAERLFGKKNPIGQVVHVPTGWFGGDYTITAVVADPPPNTHLKFNLLASYATRDAKGTIPAWDSYWDYTYFQLSPLANIEKVKTQLAFYSDKHLKQEGIRLNMQRLIDIRLHSQLTYEIEANSDANSIRALAFIGLFILFIAFINYINLTTSRSITRAKEVSVRKVLGANRRQLIKQFLVEGGLVSALAIILSLLLLWFAVPWFESFLERPLIKYYGFQQNIWLLLPAIWVLAVLSACLYPAIALSSFSPIKTLRTNLSLSGKNNLRRALVVFQFACSTILIIGIVVIVQQLRFMRNHDKGLSLEKVIALKIPEPDWRQDSINLQKTEVFRQQISQLTGVRSVATSSIVPGQGMSTIAGTSSGLFWTENPALVSSATVYFYYTDPGFFPTYKIRFLAGATYQALTRRESNGHVIINEAALKLFGFPNAETAIGKNIANSNNPSHSVKVHGVVSDFHIESSKEPVRPTFYHCTPPLTSGFVSIKAANADLQNLLRNLEQVWKKMYPEAPFDYSFVEERFNQQFKAEEQLAVIVTGFTIFAVFIACLGLFALAFITAGQRTKEIGVRKVLGASVKQIVSLLNKDYLKLVVIAIIIGSPAAGWLMDKWLQNFAYRIEIEWWMFALAAFMALGVAMLTVSFQSIKAAKTNPVKNLRTE